MKPPAVCVTRAAGCRGPHRDALPAEDPGEQVARLLAPRAAAAGPRPRATVTRLPNRAKTCASSTPMAPPPSTTSDSGTRSASIASWLVQNGCRPGPGPAGPRPWCPPPDDAPARRSTCGSPPERRGQLTATSPGALIRPCPRTRMPPLPVNRSTATLSSQSSVASSRIRRATGAQSGAISARPAMPGIRRPSAIRSAARIIIFEGTHPQYGHSPPTSRLSTPATASPASARVPAACSPPGPMPMTTTSTFRSRSVKFPPHRHQPGASGYGSGNVSAGS